MVSRYVRFKHISHKAAEFYNIIHRKQNILKEEYIDATERFERLHALRQEEGKSSNPNTSEQDFDFDLADLTIYLRWFISQAQSQKDYNIFFTRMKVDFISLDALDISSLQLCVNFTGLSSY